MLACKENPRRERGRRKPGRIGVERWPEQEIRDDLRSKPPIGRFTNFTPLNTPIVQVLMQIKDEGALTFPGKLKGDPRKRPKDKYCGFHRDHGYDTTDCYDLK